MLILKDSPNTTLGTKQNPHICIRIPPIFLVLLVTCSTSVTLSITFKKTFSLRACKTFVPLLHLFARGPSRLSLYTMISSFTRLGCSLSVLEIVQFESELKYLNTNCCKKIASNCAWSPVGIQIKFTAHIYIHISCRTWYVQHFSSSGHSFYFTSH